MRERFRRFVEWAKAPALKGASDALSKGLAALLLVAAGMGGVLILLAIQHWSGWTGEPFCNISGVKSVCAAHDDSTPTADASVDRATATGSAVCQRHANADAVLNTHASPNTDASAVVGRDVLGRGPRK